MSVEKNVPEIRFKEFSGAWEKDKLGQLYNFQYGEFNNNPSNGGQYPVYGANGVIGGYTRFNAKSSAVIGHMGEYAGSVLWAEGEHFVTYNGTIAKPKKSDFNPLFGYFSLVKMNLKKICGGSGQPFLSYDSLERLDLVFPVESEQAAIGNTFQKLDSLINQHQQKHDKLSNIKKAMLEKMFPKQGETIPEIRFKGFSGAWEEKELRQIATYRNGKAHEQSIAANGSYIVVNSKFVSTNGDVKKYANEQISPLLRNEICFVLSDVPNGKAIARTFLIAEDNLYTLNQRIAGITPNETSHHYFLYILLNRNPVTTPALRPTVQPGPFE